MTALREVTSQRLRATCHSAAADWLAALARVPAGIFCCLFLSIHLLFISMNSVEQHILGLLALSPGGLSASELRAQVLPEISQPTLWRRLDALRASGQVRRVGHGRAVRYFGAASGHAIADLRSKALHGAVGRKLLRRPELLEVARRRLEQMRLTAPYAETYIERWESLLSGPIESILQVLGADDEDSTALRHASPFAGLLSEQERLATLHRQGLMR
jgi:hypothetical protein